MASCSRNSNSPVSSEDYSAELRLMGDFNNTSLMKWNNADYGVLLMMETGLFCHPSPDWYSSGGVVKRMIRRKVSQCLKIRSWKDFTLQMIMILTHNSRCSYWYYCYPLALFRATHSTRVVLLYCKGLYLPALRLAIGHLNMKHMLQ